MIQKPTIKDLAQRIDYKINTKTKPLYALGQLETIAKKICVVQQTENPQLINPHIVVFAGDHGISNEGVSAYPKDVTWQMVLNFLNGGAAINVFAKQHGITLKIVDAGVDKFFDTHKNLINAKINNGTKNYLLQPAMSFTELNECKINANKIIDKIAMTGCNIIGFGEMGIGNTSSASLIMHCLTGTNLNDCIGKGTGLTNEQLEKKCTILKTALSKHQINYTDIESVLQTFGGFEIAMMAYAFLCAYKHGMIVLVDGFIATAAFLIAFKINEKMKDCAIFCHQSSEKGHELLLNYLQVNPLLNMNMRLGEGTGCAVAYPIIQSAVNFMNEMASFESAAVSGKQ